MNREFYLIFALCNAITYVVRTPNTVFFLRIGVGSFDGVRDFNADLCKNIETTSVCLIAFNQKSDVVVFFYLGEGRGIFWEREAFRGRHKGFFEEVGGGNKVVCWKTRTLLTCLLGKKIRFS